MSLNANICNWKDQTKEFDNKYPKRNIKYLVNKNNKKNQFLVI